MKGVTLWQPWAQMIALGHKTVETRSWPTKHRGPLAIHAARRLDPKHIDMILGSPAFEMLGRGHQHLLLEDLTTTRYPLGAVVATCNLIDCVRIDDHADAVPALGTVECALGDYGPGRFMWLLDDVKPVSPPVACRGAQAVWDVPAQTRLDIARAVDGGK